MWNFIADTTKQCDQATFQGKYNRLTVANVLLRSTFLSDLLLPAKTLNLGTKKNTDIITIVNLVWITHEKYIKLEKIYSLHPETNANTKRCFVKHWHSKSLSKGNAEKLRMQERVSREVIIKSLIQDIIKCFEQRYGDMMGKVHEDANNTVKETTEGDRLL